MLPFKLAFSIVLLVIGLLSVGILYYTQPRRIKLDSNGEYEPLRCGSDGVRPDPFDITGPEDAVDGYPVEPQKFWKRMRLVKSFVYAPHSVTLSRNP